MAEALLATDEELEAFRNVLLTASDQLLEERDAAAAANQPDKVKTAEEEFDRIAVVLATVQGVINRKEALRINAVAERLDESIRALKAVGLSTALQTLEDIVKRLRHKGGFAVDAKPDGGGGSSSSGASTGNAQYLSSKGTKLIQAFESCERSIGGGKFKAYYDPVGVLTIGWGHTNDNGRQFDTSSVWTQNECDAAFQEDMRHFEKAVKGLVTVPLDQNQFDALVSFCYNCGEGNLGGSTLLKKVNSRDFSGAAKEFGKWVHGGGKVLKGLVRRRASEALLFQGVADENYDGISDKQTAKEVDSVERPDISGFGLEPEFASKLVALLAKCKEFGLDFRISQGLRPPQTQARYYCQWKQRSPEDIDAAASKLKKAGAPWLASVLLQYRDIKRIPRWQTSALPGAGWHQWGEAADCYCYRNGKMVKSGSDPCYRRYADAAQALGLTAGLYFSKPDAGHVQLRKAAGASSVYSWSKIDQVMRQRFSDKP